MRWFTVLLAISTTGLASAQCRTVQYVQQAYAAPYVQQYEVIRPVAVATFVVPNSYYSVSPELADARIRQQIADDAAEHAINKLMQLLQQQQQQGNINPPPAAAITPRVEHPSSLNTKVQSIVNAQCVTCHHGPGSKNLSLDLRDVTKLTDAQASRIVLRTTLNKGDKGVMPPSGETLHEQEYADVAHWAFELSQRGGAPASIPPAVPDAKASPKPPLPPSPPMDKAKGGEDLSSDFGDDDDGENILAARKKKPKPRPKPRPIG